MLSNGFMEYDILPFLFFKPLAHYSFAHTILPDNTPFPFEIVL